MHCTCNCNIYIHYVNIYKLAYQVFNDGHTILVTIKMLTDLPLPCRHCYMKLKATQKLPPQRVLHIQTAAQKLFPICFALLST